MMPLDISEIPSNMSMIPELSRTSQVPAALSVALTTQVLVSKPPMPLHSHLSVPKIKVTFG